MRHDRRAAAFAAESFEALESRLALYASPVVADLPDPGSMVSTQNTVVRLYTSEGPVDIELYDQQGPGTSTPATLTVANFLNYVNSGRYDNTFFHRLVATPTPFVLQGGGFSFVPPSTSQEVTTDPPVQNEFHSGRSNVERTVAMAKLGGNPNSATSQFFFNLGNNASNLDFQNGGFTVFGKVIQGWEVVQAITALNTRDLDQFFTGSNPSGGLYEQVPLRGPADTDLVTIIDAEVIKPGGQAEFFTTSLYYPEGYAWSRIGASVDLMNEDVNGGINYQIIARFETGGRDVVIASGTIAAGSRTRVQVSGPGLSGGRQFTPFAYEIRATGPVAATLHHRDFGALTTESFIDPEPYSEDQLRSWSFAGGIKGPGIPSFLVWQSLATDPATLTVTFTAETGETLSFEQSLGALRRGGLNLNAISGIPAGLFSVSVTSTRPIVAAMSQYRSAPARASSELGALNGGGASGVLPAAIIPGDGQSLISLYYPGMSTAPVSVTVSFVLSDGTVLDGGQHEFSASGRRRDFDLSVLNGALPTDQFFTIRYVVSTPGEKLAASYTSITAGDTVRTPFQTLSTGEIFFGGGFTDPGGQGREVLSLFNAYGADVSITYRLRFQFVDDPGQDEVVFSSQGTLAGGRRIDFVIAELAEVMAKINGGSQFRRYSIAVETDLNQSTTPVTGAVWGQLTRTGGNETVTYGPTLAHDQPALAPGALG